MSEGEGRKRLGRGLAALLGDAAAESAEPDRGRAGVRRLQIAFLTPNRYNPRRQFDERELEELAQSIRERGVLQPILVRPAGGADRYEIVAGERRWRAARLAGLHEVPALVRDLDDRAALEVAIVENVQRSDLNALDEAMGYERLIAEFGYSQAELGQVIGKSRSHVANTLRLVKLPEEIKDHVAAGRLTAGHARALLTAADPSGLARRIVAEGLSVRDAERLAAEPVTAAVKRVQSEASRATADIRAVERRVGDRLGLAAKLAHKPDGSGELRLRYRTLDQLDALLAALGAGED